MNLAGAVDLHVHTAPDVVPRRVDDRELVAAAADAGMAAVLLKSHVTLTADRATLASRDGKVRVFGGLVLNRSVGGLNPVAVETAIELGAKQIWMPTLHAQSCMDQAEVEMFVHEVRRGRKGISILDRDGKLIPELYPLLEVIRDADVILGTGHLSPDESLALLRAASRMRVRKKLVTHPHMHFTFFDRERMHAAVDCGARLEFDALSCTPGWHRAVSPAETAAAIREIGARHCVCASDGGQTSNPSPVDMLHGFARALRDEGIAGDELRRLFCDGPAELLELWAPRRGPAFAVSLSGSCVTLKATDDEKPLWGPRLDLATDFGDGNIEEPRARIQQVLARHVDEPPVRMSRTAAGR